MAGRAPAVNQMRTALMRCGLNRVTADYMIGDQGFDSTEELLMASKDSFDSMIKNAIRSAPVGVTFASTSVRRLGAFKFLGGGKVHVWTTFESSVVHRRGYE